MTYNPTVSHPQRWLILGVILAVEVMDLLDSTVVNVAGPTLSVSLGATAASQLQWVIGGYALSLGAFLILGGRLGDRFGRRRMFLVGLAGFTLVSVLCSLAPTIEVLIALRLVQGVFAAMLLPQGFGLMKQVFSPMDIGKAFAVLGPVYGLGAIIGPIIGGAIIQANFFDAGWRPIFLVNLPIGVAAFVLGYRLLPKMVGDRAIKIDLVGAAIVVVAAGLLVYPLIQGLSAGWPAWTFISIATSLTLFALFAVQQRHSAKRGGTPLVVPTIFRKRSYVSGLAGILLFFAGLVGIQLTLTLFLQFGEQFSAGKAALSNIPLALGAAIGGTISGAWLATKFGRGVLQLGAVLQLAGAGILWFALEHFAVFSIWQLVPGLVVAGVGTGLVVAALFDIVLGSVEEQEVGSATGVLSSVQSIAGATGVAVLGTVFFSAAQKGDATGGFQNAILVLVALLLAFLVLSAFFPRRAREEMWPESGGDGGEQWAAAEHLGDEAM